ncbi:MAG: hypothetical protein IBX69_18805 [Anaerolineales bacterium]|nr:hypothetical protein [Anaerolineales bacterium]
MRLPKFSTNLLMLVSLIVIMLIGAGNLANLVLASENEFLENGLALFFPLLINEDFNTPTPTATQTPVPTVTPTPTSTFEPPSDSIWVDKNSIALFEHIPEQYLTTAGNLHMLFADRSVGQNINEGLDCLTASSWSASPASCRRDYYDNDWNWKTFTQADLDQGIVPEAILFSPDPIRYSRSNWTYEFHMGTWSNLTQDFIQNMAPAYLNDKDILSYQFSYLNVAEGDDIIDPQTGFFTDNPNRYTVYDLEAFIAQHPDKVFIFWTTSLARGIGTQVSTDFNNAMRQYAIDNSKIMFDVADILSHRPDGTPCFDNRDGVPYCDMHGNCEDHPDDGLDLPAICQEYTTETDGGHLGSVSAGKIRVAKAFWVLMAQIAGWDGSH